MLRPRACRACCRWRGRAQTENSKPIQCQHGLSNCSHIQFGDDRASFKKPMSQAMCQLTDKFADKISTSACPQKHSMQPRRQDYEEANGVVGRPSLCPQMSNASE